MPRHSMPSVDWCYPERASENAMERLEYRVWAPVQSDGAECLVLKCLLRANFETAHLRRDASARLHVIWFVPGSRRRRVDVHLPQLLQNDLCQTRDDTVLECSASRHI